MGRVSNAQQSRPVPALKPIDLDGQDLDLFPVPHLVHALAQPGSDLANVAAESIDAARLDVVIGAFGDDQARLKVIRAIDKDQCLSVVDIAKHLSWVAWHAAKPKPQDIDGHTMFDHFQSGCAAGNRVTAIATHHEFRANLHLSAVVAGNHACNALAVSFEVHHFVLHQQLKRGKPLSMTGNEVQKIPLRHERHEFTLCRHTAKIGHFERGISEDDSERLHPLMGHLEELLEQPEFPEYLKSGWVY